jgi:hypothetical protein
MTIPHAPADSRLQLFQRPSLGRALWEDGPVQILGRVATGLPDHDRLPLLFPLEDGTRANAQRTMHPRGTRRGVPHDERPLLVTSGTVVSVALAWRLQGGRRDPGNSPVSVTRVVVSDRH